MPRPLVVCLAVRRVLALAAALPVAAAIAGCAHSQTAEEKQLAEMRETMSRMQIERDRIDQRLEALELAVADEKSADAAKKGAQPAAAAAPMSPPRVVQLGGDDRGENDDPNEPAARPRIEVTGPGGGGGPGGRSAASAARASALDPDAKKTYEKGLSQVQGKRYDDGLDTLAAFLVKWPDHPYAENAMYWRGEAYFAKGDYAKAQEQFEGVLSRFGAGNKAPDALLKLGMCSDRLGAPDRAREYWDRLKRDYPRSDAAKRIPAAPATGAGAREDRSKGPKESR